MGRRKESEGQEELALHRCIRRVLYLVSAISIV